MKSHLKAVIALHEKLHHLWKAKPSNPPSDEQLAAENLFGFSTFRLPAASDHNPFVGFSVMKAAIGRCLKSTGNAPLTHQVDGIIISSSSCDHANAQHYIRSMSGKKNLAYVIKDRISFRGEFSVSEWFVWFFFAARQSLRTLNTERRSTMALTIVDVLEIAIIAKWLHRHNIRDVYDFVPFEVDSNFMYLITRTEGVQTTKIPSPGPLSTHNKIMLSDVLVLSGGYHLEELKHLEHRYRVGRFVSWPPERAHTYYDLYTKGNLSTTPKTLGFYSHGEWIRKRNGLIQGNSPLLQAEEDVLHYLGKFLSEHPDFRLTIYPHPKERKSCSTEELTAYYAGLTGISEVHIASADKGTTFRFQETDIAITCYSTIIFERLYCGFKTIIKKIDEQEFPKPGSPLNGVCFEDYAQLSSLLLHCSSLSASDFFKTFGMEYYLYQRYPTPHSA